MTMRTRDWAGFSAALEREIHHQLFTVLEVDREEGLVRRSYSSDELHFPSGGTKRLMQSSWAAHVIASGRIFRSHDQQGFRQAFSDHLLLEKLGLFFALNVPRKRNGVVFQTVNLLRGEVAFSAMEASLIEAELAAFPD